MDIEAFYGNVGAEQNEDQDGEDFEHEDFVPTTEELGQVANELNEDLDQVLESAAENLQSLMNTAYSKAAPSVESLLTLTKNVALGSNSRGISRNNSVGKANSMEQFGSNNAASSPSSKSMASPPPALREGIASLWSSVTSGIAVLQQSMAQGDVNTYGGSNKESPQYGSQSSGLSAPVTRFAQKIKALQANPEVYGEPVEDRQDFLEWTSSFEWEVNGANQMEASMILRENAAILDLFQQMVPSLVDEELFWMRYFFAKHLLEVEENRRIALLQAAAQNVTGGDEPIGWSDDEDEEDDQELDDKQDEEQEQEEEEEGSREPAPTPATGVPEPSVKLGEKSKEAPAVIANPTAAPLAALASGGVSAAVSQPMEEDGGSKKDEDDVSSTVHAKAALAVQPPAVTTPSRTFAAAAPAHPTPQAPTPVRLNDPTPPPPVSALHLSPPANSAAIGSAGATKPHPSQRQPTTAGAAGATGAAAPADEEDDWE
mmetsp:Transcript_4345/g.7950  ORF Transcript_4345/g.7950 Transcript_4345/m.7950 type:complete len:487 (-) Transcript_4345:70-1530(-)